ncbi:hypothetical protein ACT89R_01755 [Rhodococcus qingshengii]
MTNKADNLLAFLLSVFVIGGLLAWLWIGEWRWFATGILLGCVVAVIAGRIKAQSSQP